MFLGRNKKPNVYPCKPQFYHIKVGFMGVKIRKNIRFFYLKIFIFLMVKFSIYLNRRVFVLTTSQRSLMSDAESFMPYLGLNIPFYTAQFVCLNTNL